MTTIWTKLDLKKIVSHLVGKKEDGTDVLGVYPLLPDGTCRFIVFDFDNHEKEGGIYESRCCRKSAFGSKQWRIC